MNWARIVLNVSLKTQFKRPALLVVALLGLASGTGLYFAMNLVQARVVRSLEPSYRGLPWWGERKLVEHQLLKGVAGRVSRDLVEECESRAHLGLRCRAWNRKSEVIEGQRVTVFEIRDPILSSSAPIVSEDFRVESGAAFQIGNEKLHVGMVFPGIPGKWVALDATELTVDFDQVEVGLAEWGDRGAWETFFSEKVNRSSVRVLEPEGYVAEQQGLTESYRLNLRILSWMSIVVAALLIWNVARLQSFTLRPIFSKMRMLGLSSRDGLRLLVTEQVFMGLVGASLGIGIGLLLETGISSLVIRTLGELYQQELLWNPEVRFEDLIFPILAGTLVYVTSFSAATVGIMRLSPNAGRARTRVLTDENASRSKRILRLLLWGGVLVVLVVSFLFPVAGYAGIGAVFALMVLLSEPFLRGALAVLRWIALKDGGFRFPILTLSVLRGIKVPRLFRSSVSTVAIALSLVVGIQLMISGFRATLIEWLDVAFSAEWVATPAGKERLSEIDFQEARRVTGVEGVDCIFISDGVFRGNRIKVGGIQDALPPGYSAPFWLVSSIAGQSARQILETHQLRDDLVIITESLATREKIKTGDSIEFSFASEPSRRYQVIAIGKEFSSEWGYLLFPRKHVVSQLESEGCNNLRIYGKNIQSADVLASLPRDRFEVRPSVALKADALATFENTFAVTSVMTVIAALLGGLALLVQLSQGFEERRLEWFTLKRTGLSGFRLSKLMSLEVAFSVFCGCILGFAGGLVLERILLYSVHVHSFGWVIDSANVWDYVMTLVRVLGYGLLLWLLGSLTVFLQIGKGAKWRIVRE